MPIWLSFLSKVVNQFYSILNTLSLGILLHSEANEAQWNKNKMCNWITLSGISCLLAASNVRFFILKLFYFSSNFLLSQLNRVLSWLSVNHLSPNKIFLFLCISKSPVELIEHKWKLRMPREYTVRLFLLSVSNFIFKHKMFSLAILSEPRLYRRANGYRLKVFPLFLYNMRNGSHNSYGISMRVLLLTAHSHRREGESSRARARQRERERQLCWMWLYYSFYPECWTVGIPHRYIVYIVAAK